MELQRGGTVIPMLFILFSYEKLDGPLRTQMPYSQEKELFVPTPSEAPAQVILR